LEIKKAEAPKPKRKYNKKKKADDKAWATMVSFTVRDSKWIPNSGEWY
jgi:hypothetical protein